MISAKIPPDVSFLLIRFQTREDRDPPVTVWIRRIRSTPLVLCPVPLTTRPPVLWRPSPTGPPTPLPVLRTLPALRSRPSLDLPPEMPDSFSVGGSVVLFRRTFFYAPRRRTEYPWTCRISEYRKAVTNPRHRSGGQTLKFRPQTTVEI